MNTRNLTKLNTFEVDPAAEQVLTLSMHVAVPHELLQKINDGELRPEDIFFPGVTRKTEKDYGLYRWDLFLDEPICLS